MTFSQLKQELTDLHLENIIENFKGFNESKEFEHFETFFEMLNEPQYTLMQCKDSEEFNTSKDTWFLCLPKDGKMYAIDAGNEDDICEQYYNLIDMLSHGFGTAEMRKKDNKGNNW